MGKVSGALVCIMSPFAEEVPFTTYTVDPRTSTTSAVFACMGGDLVIVTAGEAESPRRDLAPSARFMYLVPIGCYVLGSFLVGFNINYMDPKLYHPFATWNYTTSHSPFIIALESIPIGILPTILKACFLFSAYTAA
jgi:yeast amino acid transporter